MTKRRLIKTMILLLAVFQALAWATPALAWSYRISKGDSLYKISQRYGTSVSALRKGNRLSSSRIFAGAALWIPDSKPMPRSRGNDDLYLLARLINGEARGESYQGQVAVGAVILNRVQSQRFPNTIAGNVYKRGEFESVSNGQIWREVSAASLKAARAALAGQDPARGALYFYNPVKIRSKTNWIWSCRVIQRIGRHVFAV